MVLSKLRLAIASPDHALAAEVQTSCVEGTVLYLHHGEDRSKELILEGSLGAVLLLLPNAFLC